MTLTLVRNDAAAPSRAPGTRAWEVRDAAGRLRGVVAGSGRSWTAGRIGPKRSQPFVDMVHAETRQEAARRLVEGGP